MTAAGSNAGHGSRAFYIDASLQAQVVPLASEPPGATSVAASGFGMWSGRLFFTAFISDCLAMYVARSSLGVVRLRLTDRHLA